MIYLTLYRSNLLKKNNNYERNLIIVTSGTLIYTILKYILSNKIFGYYINSISNYLYYLAILDLSLTILYIKRKKENNEKNTIIPEDDAIVDEDNQIENKKNIFNDLGLINIFSDGLLNNKKKNFFNLDNFNDDNSHDNDLMNNDINNLNNLIENNELDDNDLDDFNKIDNSNSLENVDDLDNLQNIDSMDSILLKTELDSYSDDESEYIPIYRSKKNKNNKNMNRIL